MSRSWAELGPELQEGKAPGSCRRWQGPAFAEVAAQVAARAGSWRAFPLLYPKSNTSFLTMLWCCQFPPLFPPPFIPGRERDWDDTSLPLTLVLNPQTHLGGSLSRWGVWRCPFAGMNLVPAAKRWARSLTGFIWQRIKYSFPMHLANK